MDPNVAIAIFTAVAAIAALISAVGSLLASFQAKKTAEESKKIAEEQTKALMTAAKANALASRIDFYTQQLTPLRDKIQNGRVMGTVIVKLQEEEKEYTMQQNHLAWWLDRQMDELKVGLRHECPESPYNTEIPRWRGEQPTTGAGS
jgi:hypothetical protein